MAWLRALLAVTAADAATRRRCRLTIIIALSLITLALLFVPVMLVSPGRTLALTSVGLAVAVYSAVIMLARRGRAALAGGVFVGTVLLVVLVNLFAPVALSTTLFYLMLPVLLSSLVLRPAYVWGVLALALLLLAGAVTLNPALSATPNWASNAVGSALLMTFVAFMGYLGGRETERALAAAAAHARHLAEAQERAEAQAGALAVQAEALAQAEAAQRALVAQLETPAVGLADGIVMAPIIGAMDSRRAQLLTERLLRQVSDQRAQLLVLDLTGMSVVDTLVAQALLQLVQAVRLLGCEVVVTGISATVASTITTLGIDLSGVRTLRSPQDVLLRQVGG